jgi:formylglycine-generating enzyme required for sulfatase activity
VILVSWDDAVAYCAWLSSVTNQQYRLLSESEWEYCCRSGSSGPFYFGNTLTTLQANFNGAHRYGGKLGGRNRESTVEVDALPPNDWGLYQMHGNAWEWVADKFAHGYAGCPVDGSANETGEDDYRCMRGGSWTDPPKHLRSACRGWVEPDLRSYSVGFRVARDL